jgi:hypothetical protein
MDGMVRRNTMDLAYMGMDLCYGIEIDDVLHSTTPQFMQLSCDVKARCSNERAEFDACLA